MWKTGELGLNDVNSIIKNLREARKYLEDKEWIDKEAGLYIDGLNDAIIFFKTYKNQTQESQEIEEPHSWEHIWDALDYTFKGRCRNCGFIHYFIQGHDAQYRFCPQCGEQKFI